MTFDYRDYKPLPWWTKIRNRTLRNLLCRLGLHTPAKAVWDGDGTRTEVFCQECMVTLTEEDWNAFWRLR